MTAGQREYVAELQRRSDAEREQAQLAREYSNITQSSFSTFIDDLRSGTSVADAFRNALDRVIDGLINMTIEATFASRGFENLFSQLAGFGGFGGLGQFGIASGGGIGLYHGGGIVGPGHGPRRNVNPLMFANAPRLHNGLLPGEFPAILQRGEMVIPRSMVKRGGGTMIDNSQTSYGDITVNVPGQVVASDDEGKRLGIMINRAVERVLVSEGRPGGILRRVPQ
ncbi:hypothetical protein [Sinorhizobium meliloti]|uniref:hypothetical protein n=1 Tax=Rhizobium meliloti TaxID=382 RepID=UPI001F25458E|nr:hypothetical protein [Sinorhizobium meliloti]